MLPLTTTANGLVATLLENVTKGTGTTALRILLIDTWASSLIFLSVSCVLLRVKTNRWHAAGAVVFSTALFTILALELTQL